MASEEMSPEELLLRVKGLELEAKSRELELQRVRAQAEMDAKNLEVEMERVRLQAQLEVLRAKNAAKNAAHDKAQQVGRRADEPPQAQSDVREAARASEPAASRGANGAAHTGAENVPGHATARKGAAAALEARTRTFDSRARESVAAAVQAEDRSGHVCTPDQLAAEMSRTSDTANKSRRHAEEVVKRALRTSCVPSWNGGGTGGGRGQRLISHPPSPFPVFVGSSPLKRTSAPSLMVGGQYRAWSDARLRTWSDARLALITGPRDRKVRAEEREGDGKAPAVGGGKAAAVGESGASGERKPVWELPGLRQRQEASMGENADASETDVTHFSLNGSIAGGAGTGGNQGDKRLPVGGRGSLRSRSLRSVSSPNRVLKSVVDGKGAKEESSNEAEEAEEEREGEPEPEEAAAATRDAVSTNGAIAKHLPGDKDLVPFTSALQRMRDVSQEKMQESDGGMEARTWVGVGISAGGLESVQEFVSKFTRGSRCTVIVVQHLSPDYPSMMTDILARSTQLQVLQVEDGMEPLEDTVYTTPPGKVFTIKEGRFRVRRREVAAVPTIIDTVFCCLAEEYGASAIGVILSGTGSDGAKGIVAIKTVGGICMAEDHSARFDGMPLSALQTGSVDIVAAPAVLAEHVIACARFSIEQMREWGIHDDARGLCRDDPSSQSHSIQERRLPVLSRILNIVCRLTGQDFHAYKEGTIARRIQRRVAACAVDSTVEYLELLEGQNGADEAQRLVSDLLIHVTGFFRDGDLWEYLQADTLPSLLDRVVEGKRSLRVWVAGCSTGEEAYSFACAIEALRTDMGIGELSVTIFATDVDPVALEVASRGVYTELQMHGVPEQFRDRFFARTANGEYQVLPHVRKRVVFAIHNILSSPPYFQIDLISCRNVLIYFKAEAQSKVLHVMRYSLRPDGIMVLGHAEALTKDSEPLFTPLDDRLRVFRCIGPHRRSGHFSTFLDMSALSALGGRSTARSSAPPAIGPIDHIAKTVNEFLVRRHAPPTIVFNDEQQLLFTVGDVSEYLSVTRDQSVPSLDVMKCVRRGLASALSIATRSCRKGAPEASFKGLPLDSIGGEHADRRGSSGAAREVADPPTAGRSSEATAGELRVRCSKVVNLNVTMLLGASGERLFAATFEANEPPQLSHSALDGGGVAVPAMTAEGQDLVAHLEDELQTTRRQLQTTVEELESANEELQSTIEELLSSNEELQSTNEELQSVNEELFTVNNEYTSKIRELTELNLDLMNLLHGTDIGCIFLDENLCIRKYTDAVSKHIPLRPGDIGRPLRELVRPPFQCVISDSENALFAGDSCESEVGNEAGQYFLVRSLPYRDEREQVVGAVVTFLDVTRLKRTLLEVEVQRARAELAHKAKSEFLESVSHETRSPVHAISGFAELLLASGELTEDGRRCVANIYQSSRLLTSLLDDVLLLSAAENEELVLLKDEFNVQSMLYEVAQVLSVSAEQKGLELLVEVDPHLPLLCVQDASRLRQVLFNLSTNAIKFTDTGYVKLSAELVSLRSVAGEGKRTASPEREQPEGAAEASSKEAASEGGTDTGVHFMAMVRFSVRDSGCGIEKQMQEKVFEKFVQQDSTVSRRTGGVGLGLSIVRKFVALLQGTCTLKSQVGEGSTFDIELECEALRHDGHFLCLGDYAQFPVGSGLKAAKEAAPADDPLHRARVTLVMPRCEYRKSLSKTLSGMHLLGEVCDGLREAEQATGGGVVVIDARVLTGQGMLGELERISPVLNERFDVIVCVFSLSSTVRMQPRWTELMPSIRSITHPLPLPWLLSLMSNFVCTRSATGHSESPLKSRTGFTSPDESYFSSARLGSPTDLHVEHSANGVHRPNALGAVNHPASTMVSEDEPLGRHSQDAPEDGIDHSGTRESGKIAPRVLVVDDNAVNLMVAKRLLQRIGCEVQTASSALEGVRQARTATTPFDLVLCDLAMPGVSGFDMLPLMRAVDAYEHVPIVALTATKTGVAREKALQVGFTDYMCKPVGMMQLAGLLQRCGFEVEPSFVLGPAVGLDISPRAMAANGPLSARR